MRHIYIGWSSDIPRSLEKQDFDLVTENELFFFFFFKKEKHFDNLNEQYNFRAGPSAEPSTLFDRLKKQKQKH